MARHTALKDLAAPRRTRLLVILVAIIGTGALIWNSSNAAFSGTTSNASNSWAAGQVNLTDDDSSTALFSVTGLKPGSTGSNCITVTYTGSVASSVKLYATGYTGTLGTYLNLTVEQGTGGSFGSCGSFVAGSTLYTGTLAGFATAKVDWASGVGSFTPSSNPTSAVYRFTYTLQDNNSAQNLSSTCGFTWEAQST
jgi:hypothetical protein